MKAKGHWVWLVAKKQKKEFEMAHSRRRVKAVPRAAAVYDRQLKILLFNSNTVVARNIGSQNRGNLQNRGQNLNDQSDH